MEGRGHHGQIRVFPFEATSDLLWRPSHEASARELRPAIRHLHIPVERDAHAGRRRAWRPPSVWRRESSSNGNGSTAASFIWWPAAPRRPRTTDRAKVQRLPTVCSADRHPIPARRRQFSEVIGPALLKNFPECEISELALPPHSSGPARCRKFREISGPHGGRRFPWRNSPGSKKTACVDPGAPITRRPPPTPATRTPAPPNDPSSPRLAKAEKPNSPAPSARQPHPSAQGRNG